MDTCIVNIIQNEYNLNECLNNLYTATKINLMKNKAAIPLMKTYTTNSMLVMLDKVYF
jgi:hypothetical protein